MESVGIDIADVGFFRKRPYAAHAAFYDMVFTDAERRRCLARRDPAVGFAICFAIKEAAVKALSACGGTWATVAATQVESARRSERSGDAPLRLLSRRGEPTPPLTGLRILVSCTATHALAMAVVAVSAADATTTTVREIQNGGTAQ